MSDYPSVERWSLRSATSSNTRIAVTFGPDHVHTISMVEATRLRDKLTKVLHEADAERQASGAEK